MKIPGGKQKRVPVLWVTEGSDPLDEAYTRKAEALGQEIAATRGPGFYHVNVAHDDWCPKLKGGPCRCEPDVTSA